MSNTVGQLLAGATLATIGTLAIVELTETTPEPVAPVMALEPAEVESAGSADAPPAPEESGVGEASFAMTFDTTTGLEGGGTVYGVFSLAPEARTADDVRLNLRPAPGVRVEDVVGYTWNENGSDVTITIGAVDSMRNPTVVVRLTVRDGGSPTIESSVSIREGNNLETEPPRQWAVSGSLTDPDVLVDVREAYTRRALALAREGKAEERYDEALELITVARADNVEAGLTYRISGELEDLQRSLVALEEEIEEARKPKPVVRKRAPKKPGIEFVRGDQS